MLVDSHAHVATPDYAADKEQWLLRARDADIDRIVVIRSPFEQDDLPSLAAAAKGYGIELYQTLGVHPHDASRYAGAIEDLLLAEEEALSAIGEIGLDYHYLHSPAKVQRQVFARQVRLARRLRKPVVVHTREAEDDTLALLSDESANECGGVIHCFSGSLRLIEGACEMGFFISFSGIVTFKKAEALRELVPRVPDGQLLVETDSPYLAPAPHRGKRNEPAHVAIVLDEVARLRQVTSDEAAGITSRNARKLFCGQPS